MRLISYPTDDPVINTDDSSKIAKLGVCKGILPKKKGSQNCAFLDIANGDFSESGRHIHVQNLGEYPPPRDIVMPVNNLELNVCKTKVMVISRILLLLHVQFKVDDTPNGRSPRKD